MLKVLVSPIHYILKMNNNGSEIGWSYDFFNILKNSKYYRFRFIAGGCSTGYTTDVINLNVFNVNAKTFDVSKVLCFYLRLLIVTIYQIIKYKPKILHHYLPFTIGLSFNLPIIFKLTPYSVIGPIQLPLTVSDNGAQTKFGLEKNRPSNVRYYKFSKYIIINTIFYVLTKLSKLTLNRADRIVVINSPTSDYLISIGVNGDKITIIPPGICLENYPRRDCFVGNEDENLKFVVVSALIKRKNISLVIEAFRLFNIGRKKTQLYIIGDGSEMDYLKGIVRNYGLDDCVFFLGFIEHKEISKYLIKYHVFLSGSTSESWGQMYVEAMACGLPVVAVSNHGSSSIVIDDYTGFLVDNKPQSMAKKMDLLYRERLMIKQMGENSRARVEQEYDWNVISDKYYQVYKEIN